MADSRFVKTMDGLGLHVRHYPARRGPFGLPVVCLHGLTRNSRDFEDIAPWIADLGRDVFAFDMRGRGRSDRSDDPMTYQVPTYVADVIAGLEALGVGRAVFVGTSMGGLITMTLSALRPDLVAAAVLNDVGPELDPAGLARIAGYVGSPAGPFTSWEAAAEAVRAVNGYAFPDRDLPFWLAFAHRTCIEEGGEIRFDYDTAIAAPFAAPPPDPAPDLWPVYDGLASGGPVLIVRGATSDILSTATAERMVGRAPDARLVTVSGVGHAPMLDEPEARAGLCDFLARVD